MRRNDHPNRDIDRFWGRPALGPAGVADGHSPSGTREVELDQFFVDPDDNVMVENILAPNEVITHVTIPAAARGWGESYVEVREKQTFDWALSATTVRLKMKGRQVEGARVILSAVAPRPMRLPSVEAMLRGSPDDATIAKAAEKALEGATHSSTTDTSSLW